MAAAVTPWHRAALVDRFLRPRIVIPAAAGLSPVHDLADAYVSAADVARFARDADAYASGLAGFVHDADAYAAGPADLASAHAPGPGPRPGWYFVSPTGNRAATLCGGGGAGAGGFPGQWVQQRHDRYPEGGAGGTVRQARHFFYVDNESPKTPTGWVMVENSITHGEGRRRFGEEEKLVLCELYLANRVVRRHPPS